MAISKYSLFDRLYSNEQYEDFIDFALFMWLTKRYSFFNSALILLQRPGAMFIETEEMWKKKYDRRVSPGISPIVIMQPFGPINFVYDFADTYGEQAPSYMRDSFQLPKPDPEIGKFLPELIRTINQLGIFYCEKAYGSRQGGQAEYLEKAINIKIYEKKKVIEVSTHLAIIVNKSLTKEQKATTILHEIGHILCGHLPIDKSNKKLKVANRTKEKLTVEQEEFEAEKVCELVCKAIEISYNNTEYLKGYLVNNTEPYFSVRIVVEAVDKFIHAFNL